MATGKFTTTALVLLYNGNSLPNIPLVFAPELEETYDSMQYVLDLIRYNHFKWKICADLKVVGLLLGLLGGFTKYCCFLCLWDSRNTQEHYVQRSWPRRESFVPGEKNISHTPLVHPNNVLLPLLHIKLGLMKIFVKALDKLDRRSLD